jgi:hypothetical protein
MLDGKKRKKVRRNAEEFGLILKKRVIIRKKFRANAPDWELSGIISA